MRKNPRERKKKKRDRTAAEARAVRKPYREPRLAKWQEECVEHRLFDWSAPRFEWVLTSQAAAALSLHKTSVCALIEQGRLEAREVSITGTRADFRISRRSLLLFLASTSLLDPRELAAKVAKAIGGIRCPQLLSLIDADLQSQRARLATLHPERRHS